MSSDALIYARALTRPPLYYASRILGRSRVSLHESADTSETIYPGGTFNVVPFFFWPDHLSRIRDSWAFTAEAIKGQFNLKRFDLHPLRICRFSDAWLINGSVYLRGTSRIELRTFYGNRSWIDDKSLLPTWPTVEIPDAVLGSTRAGSSWFGHWLEDELPLQILAKKYGSVISHARPLYDHEIPYLEQLGLDLPKQLSSAYFKSLTVIDEFAQNPNKVQRFLDMRNCLTLGNRRYECLYIRRGKTGAPRQILNEAQLHARLVSEGYGVVDLECCTFSELHAACRGARIIVGIEGSHLAHALYMAADHACLVILAPPYHAHTTVADLTPFFRLSSGIYVCLPNNDVGTQFTVDVDEVLAFVEDADRFARQRASTVDAFISDLLKEAAVRELP